MSEAALLHCPIRGQLRVPQRAADGLTFTEEKRRIDAIRFLLRRDYPRENFGIETTLLRFGHEGRNSFRVDFSVYNTPFEEVRHLPLDERNSVVRLAAEIKRDNISAKLAKSTQVLPALNLLPDMRALGVYWDDVEQRFFYRTIAGHKAKVHEAPISKIPAWGSDVGSTTLTHGDLEPAKDLVGVFDRVEIAIHPYVADKSKRYAVMLQLLLVKIHDENRHKGRPTAPLDFQDFNVEAITDRQVKERFDAALKLGVEYYGRFLPQKIPARFDIPPEALRRASQVLAGINLLTSKREVIQSFYMKFAKNLYKWDLAQYFTPHEVIDFIVDIINPTYGEHIKDPACGSSDFLISAFRAQGHTAAEHGESVWGSDNSEQAVQISVLNMVLNGDGKSNIVHEDSLEVYGPGAKRYSVVLCNPPFGTKIQERRFEVLRKFDSAYEWTEDEGGYLSRSEDVRPAQQTGILFAELCVRLAEPGGRVGIILPNGYLGNRSPQYVALREWILRNAKIAGIISFPRFTFKKSGADVSASVVFLERRRKPLASSRESRDYRFFVGMMESVGWRVGDKKAVPIYHRDQRDGTMIFDADNEPILDSDFASVMDGFLRSPAADCFPWLTRDRDPSDGSQEHSIAIEDVVSRPDLIIDPKRYCAKYQGLRAKIEALNHFRIGDILKPVPTARVNTRSDKLYKYIEIQNIGYGDFDFEVLRGWQLPGRARLLVERGDFFLANLWSSAGKWFMATGDCSDLRVTTGCARMHMRQGKEDHLIDLMTGLCTEAFRVQLRALTTGSDGLANISDDDLMEIILPRVDGDPEREQIQKYVDVALGADLRFGKGISRVLGGLDWWPVPSPRKHHWALV